MRSKWVFVLAIVLLSLFVGLILSPTAAPAPLPLEPTRVYRVGFPDVMEAYPWPSPPPIWHTLPPRPTVPPTLAP